MSAKKTPGPVSAGRGGDAQSKRAEHPNNTAPSRHHQLRPWQQDFAYAMRAVRQCHRDMMLAWGVSPTSQIKAGLYGVASIRIDKAGHFDFANDGRLAFLLPVYDDPASVDGDYSHHYMRGMIDIVGWMPDDPAKFWLHTGVAWALGSDQARIASWGNSGPLRVHRSPVDWLRSGCRGTVVIDQKTNGPDRLGRVKHLIASNRQHAQRLKKWTTPAQAKLPRISYSVAGRRAAS